MKLRNLFGFAIVSLLGFSAGAESKQIIVKLQPTRVAGFNFQGSTELEPVIPELGIYALTLSDTAARSGTRAAAASVRNMSGVIYAQENHKVVRRTADPSKATPNDKKFSQQWDLIKDANNFGIDATTAWVNYGVGGLDFRQNDIVVAVVDGGVDIKHEDLRENMWVNKGEIPGNKIDDDNNGYVDDIHGWDIFANNGEISPDMHGTHVAGTIGMKGNNSVHGVGINWNVKIMTVDGASGDTKTVLKSYGYVLKQKKLWLETAGMAGANVVSTNSSFGVDYGDCSSSQYSAWNDIYNEMGKVGILSAAATANINLDVDKSGDVPTGCDSEFLISVTNTQKDGKKNSGAGYGATTIDLAAPGTNIFSTTPKNGFSSLTGTSMATPHVAGAVAYLHSAASQAFNDGYYKDPAVAALILKEIMLETVTPMEALKGKTVSGGILNLNTAAQKIHAF
ncbi:MAG: S8 family serine peptidase [Bdellovibrionales bacterium]|nr:S8 family serine peptidase [Bdellovibrionales bacterium]